ncbi:hypothetical protein BK674_26085 [Pseudomonas moraviensis]|uniref:Uncharacterized protein n=1 Tax=Pseudomonas moraviensis TaxID=321662 RepID=A0A423NCK1_9PSED|nr:hypothetical protein [Pseudomonas moraviensis]RON95956.1 hypothetical protein BK674_26085 [Pseudomonas moraviensis]
MSDPSPDALKPIYFPALTTLDPKDGYDGGIPIRAVENGLQVVIPAWIEMKLQQRVDFFWNNKDDEVWSKTLEHESELNRDVTFTLPKGFVVDGDVIDVFYRISGKNHPVEESTPRLKLLVKLTRPGEYDDNAEEDGHSDLNFSLDRYEIDDRFTDKDVVTMSIVRYRNLTKFDRIHARWGSQKKVHLVTEEQALDPLKKPIDITFDYDLIQAAGDGPAVAVAYQVVDRCGNYPDERAPWSAVQSVLVDMNGDRLKPPLVLVKGQPTTRVDLDELGDDDVKVHVSTPDADFNVGDGVLLTWIGTPAQGPQIIVGPLSMPVQFVDFHLEFSIPNAAVRAIAKGSASVGFVRRRDNEADRPSRNASVNVVGDISQLRAPTVNEAPGGTLPVDTQWATVTIPWYAGRNRNDDLNLIWEAKAPGGDTVYYEDPRPVGSVPENDPVERSVDNANIQRFKGLSVKVYYVITNSETALLSVRESLPFIMQVGVPMPTFDRPEVEEADENDVLNPDEVPPTGATMVLTHTETLDKDRFNFNWKGSASGGSFSDYIDLIPATAGKPVRVTVPKQYVTANRDGTVTADYSVQRAGETLGYSRELVLRIGVALDLKEPSIKEADHNTLDPFAARDTLTAVIAAYSNMIGTQVTVTWSGVPGEGSVTTDPIDITEQADKEIPLPNSVVAFNLGKDVEVIYTVIRNGASQDSVGLSLAVLAIADGDKNLPTPAIDGAVGDELDVTRLEEGAQLRIEKWMLQAPNQCIWLRYDGTDKNGNAVEKVFWKGEAHQQTEGLVTAAQIAWFRELKDRLPLKITFKVNYNKVANADTAVDFPLRTYTIKNTNSTFIYEDFESAKLQELANFVSLSLPSGLIITPHAGSTNELAKIGLTDPQSGSGSRSYFSPTSASTTIQWHGNASSVSFLHRFHREVNFSIRYADGGSDSFKVGPDNSPSSFEHTAPPEKSIIRIYISSGGTYNPGLPMHCIDNIKIHIQG